MAEGLSTSKLAEALNKAAEEFVPKSRGTLASRLEDPEVKEAILNMRRKHMTAVEIVEVLNQNGFDTTPSSFNSTFGRILRKDKGGSHAKPKKERKADKPAEASAAKTGSPEGKTGGSLQSSERKPTEIPADTGGAKQDNPTAGKHAVNPAYRDRKSL